MKVFSRSVLSVSIVLFSSIMATAQDNGPGAERSYVSVTVRGILIRDTVPYDHYHLDCLDLAGQKLVVWLGRTEDKDHELDRLLRRLEGSTLTVNAPLHRILSEDETQRLDLTISRFSLVAYDRKLAATPTAEELSTPKEPQ